MLIALYETSLFGFFEAGLTVTVPFSKFPFEVTFAGTILIIVLADTMLETSSKDMSNANNIALFIIINWDEGYKFLLLLEDEDIQQNCYHNYC